MKALLSGKENVLSLFGALLLFGSWLSQQLLFEKWNSRLTQVEAARAGYQTYQATNALFNALGEIHKDDKDKRQKIRELQVKNYRYGLDILRDSLGKGRLQALHDEVEHRTKEFSLLDLELAEVQAELVAIQVEHAEEAGAIRSAKRTWRVVFVILYICGSLSILGGMVLKGYSKQDERPSIARSTGSAGGPAPGICACGCGQPTKGATFVRGHDAKLRATIEQSVGVYCRFSGSLRARANSLPGSCLPRNSTVYRGRQSATESERRLTRLWRAYYPQIERFQ
jgi:hypothetical protein